MLNKGIIKDTGENLDAKKFGRKNRIIHLCNEVYWIKSFNSGGLNQIRTDSLQGG